MRIDKDRLHDMEEQMLLDDIISILESDELFRDNAYDAALMFEEACMVSVESYEWMLRGMYKGIERVIDRATICLQKYISCGMQLYETDPYFLWRFGEWLSYPPGYVFFLIKFFDDDYQKMNRFGLDCLLSSYAMNHSALTKFSIYSASKNALSEPISQEDLLQAKVEYKALGLKNNWVDNDIKMNYYHILKQIMGIQKSDE